MISIVLCVYNEENNIKDCLESLKNQSYKDFELIIVNDGSTDNTMKIVRDYEKEFKMKIIDTKHVGLRRARNLGISRAIGEIIVTIDADEILDSKCIKYLVESFKDKKAGTVGGYIRSYRDNWIAKGSNSLKDLFYSKRDWTAGGCAAYKRELLEKLKLSEKKIGADVDISWKIKEMGYTVKIDKRAVVYHKDPQNISGVVMREYKIGRRSLKTFFAHKKYFDLRFWSRFFQLFVLILLIINWNSAISFFFIYFALILAILKSHRIYAFIILNFMNIGWSLGVLVSVFKK